MATTPSVTVPVYKRQVPFELPRPDKRSQGLLKPLFSRPSSNPKPEPPPSSELTLPEEMKSSVKSSMTTLFPGSSVLVFASVCAGERRALQCGRCSAPPVMRSHRQLTAHVTADQP